jgi:outer membrane protein OmpA-like peptidoglycan-associated protein
MKPKYLQVETGGRDRWMVSYMDVLTILLIFFVAAAAKSLEVSNVEPPKVELSKVETPKVEPATAPVPVRNPIQEKLEASGLDWRAGPRGLVISLPQAVLFQPGKAQVNPAALPTVGRIADVLRGIPNQIGLDGHTDPVPIHNRRFKNNWELAAARSLELLHLLTTRYEIGESRFTISSYGSIDPRSSNDTAEGRANNRRVEILILDESPDYPR